ncbi:tRNA 2-thiouridine(34) synthase MnmA [Buchnera aphidicola]|uniref:tRNA-specific 2-thiouridylase MnmA n=1 Tax=Buchnera aphidicola (Anoecia oenotherae) TaxID=1241833 RepID=A0A4D6Y4I8_9GAMM|nr:tRNA 2-thiouridine(34) synthase MnmA [Buchnera aphidicola]QCI19335.1 tRNA 2-thiouridine(34) synthase MnmA [Buchnera aphidicola (Anoecia oenotherae)]
MKKKNIKIVVAMSGGVDSSVTTWLLNKKGYNVEGIFMKNWEEDDNHHDGYCASWKDLKDAQAVCDSIGILLHKINFAEEYWNNVFKKFINLLKTGITPNPDVLCNKEIKFKELLNFVLFNLKADFMATGHYVRRVERKKKFFLLRGIDDHKDQSYFLYHLNQFQLSKCLFPIGNLKKRQVRIIAKKYVQVVAKKKDSMGICFIGPKKFTNFLSRFIKSSPGNIISKKGQVIGIHSGLQNYTIGQRRGLKIGGISKGNGKAWYVFKKDVKKNILFVVQGNNNISLIYTGIIVINVVWINKNPVNKTFNCTVKTRYRQLDVYSKVQVISSHLVEVRFSEPVLAICSGQSAVFYDKHICLGGGVIKRGFMLHK